MPGSMVTTAARRLVFNALSGLKDGFIRLESRGEIHEFGDPRCELRAEVTVHDERFFRRVLLGGDIGAGESFMDGDWSSPDLVSLVRIAVRNLEGLESRSRMGAWASGIADAIRHRLRANTVEGSRKNISEHYDLSNEFFELFLDRSMMYSCAWFESLDRTLEQAQEDKLDRICRKLRLAPGDRVLEIGTGWGGFAEHAAGRYGCRVTTTTISRQQFEYARKRIEASGLGHRIDLLMMDYRHLRGTWDRIVSIEMFEAVGWRFYDDFFGACDRLLSPRGSMLLQTITIIDQAFDQYRRRSDWIQKYVFPGAELASPAGILGALCRATSMSVHHLEDMGLHYAETLKQWSERFEASLDEVRRLGFDDRFIRMWRYYLAYCEAGFRERHISDVQITLTKNHNRDVLFGDPAAARPAAVMRSSHVA